MIGRNVQVVAGAAAARLPGGTARWTSRAVPIGADVVRIGRHIACVIARDVDRIESAFDDGRVDVRNGIGVRQMRHGEVGRATARGRGDGKQGNQSKALKNKHAGHQGTPRSLPRGKGSTSLSPSLSTFAV